MPHMQPLGQLFQRFTHFALPREEPEELPDDHPSKMELRTERYLSWSATAIYGFVPFQSPRR